ncbi:TetR/AcrR family transcriptional regulator [Rhizobium sp. P38BS-XIX]|uniref:TetR/AcrR family transcriptional regulator n=1 Tax=Rhizobium sp. P38BS-XIX TaxID=2726740 RepID=UPI0014574407|nr:TetR/AcrR family transcriptional regulator [Rhizobium sp. P38BS-XIX]NLR99327.1 TetR/AcrR family transcriptional regulator [Rhizobium sp. P38BS-XIX]
MAVKAGQAIEKSAQADTGGGVRARSKKSSRNPQRTQEAILEAATEEFAAHGFGGARVDAIAARAQTNKRMLYHYFGDKEGLYLAVLEATYATIRNAEKQLDLAHRHPEEGMRELALFTWRHFLAHPEFLSLLATENLHQAHYLQRSEKVSVMHSHLIDELAEVLRRGEASGIFKPAIDPISVYLTIAALGFFYLSNRHTLSTIFARKLSSSEALNAWGEHIVDVTLASIRA